MSCDGIRAVPEEVVGVAVSAVRVAMPCSSHAECVARLLDRLKFLPSHKFNLQPAHGLSHLV